jgi:hypothetical protein
VPGIDHLKEQTLWSESVYLDCVSPDGESGFIVRLCRYPTEATGWLWVHAFMPGKVYAFTDHSLACSTDVTRVDAPDVTYDLGDDSMVDLQRDGPRDNPDEARVHAAVSAHLDAQAPHGPGAHPIEVAATFTPLGASGTTVPGRIELLGEVRAHIEVDGATVEIAGYGQWHEQHQEQPRFLRPFTYFTLRGERLAFVGSRGPMRATGYARRDGAVTAIAALDIDPRGPRRALRLELADGTELRGEARTTHDYSVPIYDRRRPGTLVVAEVAGQTLSGCINDFMRD